MSDNRLEYLVIKWTLGISFLSVTILFIVKLVLLFIRYFSSGKAGDDFIKAFQKFLENLF